MARITSDFFVSAYVRRRNDAGCFTAIVKRGAAEAGAIYIKIARLDGRADLYGPAPQSLVPIEDPAIAGGRLFERLMTGEAEGVVDERLARERRFDPDCWIVECEDRSGTALLDVVEV